VFAGFNFKKYFFRSNFCNFTKIFKKTVKYFFRKHSIQKKRKNKCLPEEVLEGPKKNPLNVGGFAFFLESFDSAGVGRMRIF
jgi:hypothetical protein